MSEAHASLEAAFRSERGSLFGLLYRLTGSAADAEDLVQATFERALERPPADARRPWRPWLWRVAVNLGRDHLRTRRRRGYDGPWLPTPLETPDERLAGGVPEPLGTEGRYELLESVSYAFLVALEALTPTQRAVLLLRDVFEYGSRETAEVLGLSDVGVRQHLRRARLAMQDYDREHAAAPTLSDASVGEVLSRFLRAVASGDVDAVASLLAEDVVLVSDGGGEFHAARVPVVGRAKVARFYVNITRVSGVPRAAIRPVNGLPAVVLELDGARPGIAPRALALASFDAAGRLCRIFNVLATPKLVGVAPL